MEKGERYRWRGGEGIDGEGGRWARHGRKTWDARRPQANAWMHGWDVGMGAEGTTCVVRHRGTVHRRPPRVLALERVDPSSRHWRSHPFFSTKARRFTPTHPCACHSWTTFGSTCMSFPILPLRHPIDEHAKRFPSCPPPPSYRYLLPFHRYLRPSHRSLSWFPFSFLPLPFVSPFLPLSKLPFAPSLPGPPHPSS